MDLPVIGGRCEAYGCGVFDFLPIKCNGCQKLFCGHHIVLDSHTCPSLNTSHNDALLEDRSDAYKGKRCAVDGCHKLTLESAIVDTADPERRIVAVCSHCSRAFCATHRHASDHSCSMIPPVPTPSQKNPEAHELLSKHFPTKNSSSTPKLLPSVPRLPTDPKKVARLRAVALMKMRHHALPADPRDKASSIPPNQRLHLKVIATGSPLPEKIFWLRKTIGTGRALDLLASHFSIHISGTKAAYLNKILPDNGTPGQLRNDQLLSEQVEDGDTLCLSTGSRT